MAEIKQFPMSEKDATAPRGYVSIIFAAMTVAMAIIGGSVTGGLVMGRAESDIISVTNQVGNLTRHVDDILTAMSQMNAHVATQASQIDALRQAIQDEHRERIELERRLVPR